jgi:dTDP-4-amino-4,6-dideoxygalactose transaminase
MCAFCQESGWASRSLFRQWLEANVHHPIPLHYQDALKHLGHSYGDFRETDGQAQQGITLPVDQHMNPTQLEHVINTVRSFYG